MDQAINIKPFAGNNVRIYYTDGASLIIKSTEVDAVDYFRPSPGGGGAWVRETKLSKRKRFRWQLTMKTLFVVDHYSISF